MSTHATWQALGGSAQSAVRPRSQRVLEVVSAALFFGARCAQLARSIGDALVRFRSSDRPRPAAASWQRGHLPFKACPPSSAVRLAGKWGKAALKTLPHDARSLRTCARDSS